MFLSHIKLHIQQLRLPMIWDDSVKRAVFVNIIYLENVHFHIKSTCSCCIPTFHQCLETCLVIILFIYLCLHFKIGLLEKIGF